MPFRSPSSLLALVLVCAGCASNASVPTGPPLIPVPRTFSEPGGAFELDAEARIVLADPNDSELRHIGERFATSLRNATGLPIDVAPQGNVRLAVDGQGAAESYRLSVTGRGITVVGADHAGLFYGLQTLAQLLPPGVADGAGRGAGSSGSAAAAIVPIRVDATEIADAPRFPYRGMHLDVGRHFFGPDFVKRYIDMLARYKINRFHWHLTEDQGWRIEIDRYPRLTEVGGWRRETRVGHAREPYEGDGERYGGFYTKDEIRDIVAYAQERYVTIVPEIEMPGHSLAALAAYPELACTEGPFEVATTWGIFEDIYCPKEETFEFLEGVLTEVMELFPGEYVHIGGDEAPKTRWEESPVAQAVIEREGLADEHELQSWFIRRVERFLNANGRRLIGWDEILEGGLAPNATVMSWRGTRGGIDAARQGHDVVMTPTSHLYFDYYQSADRDNEPLAIGGELPLERVHAFEPVPAELTEAEARHVLGAQGNVWTEYMRDEDHVEYMVFPRMLALSEVAWSPADARDFDAFYARLGWHLRRLDALGVRYRIPDVGGLDGDRLMLRDRVDVPLATPLGTIRFTTDGSEPDTASRAYTEPVRLDLRRGPATLTARIELPDGRLGPVRSARYERAAPRAAALVDTTAFEPGLRVETLLGRFTSVERLERGTVDRRDGTDRVEIPSWVPAERFGLRFRGYLRVPADGVYTFRLASDDGSVLRMGNRLVLDRPAAAPPSTAAVALGRGFHPIELWYVQGTGARALALEWSRDGGPFTPVDQTVVTRVR